jgi:XTP/dITP diphosphohydrolase
MRLWPFPYIMLATHNEHKRQQLQDLLGAAFGLQVKSLAAMPSVPEIVEDQDTFSGNAIKKAQTIADLIQGPVVADDSGIVVPALGGEPGVYSARYAGEQATDAENNAKLISKIRTLPEVERAAKFVCVMALAVPGEPPRIVCGECAGVVIEQPRGSNGFGYDPIFFIPSEGATMAELPAAHKYQLSHRGKASGQLIALLRSAYRFQAMNAKE